MRTYQYDTSGVIDGVPDARVGLALKESPLPSPGSGEVLVRVKANALNFVDLSCLSGAYPVDGRVPLLDGAGVIEAIGKNVSKWQVGDRVVANPNLFWLAGTPGPDMFGAVLGITADGMLSEYVVLPENGVAAIPEGINFESAASLPCAGLSAWNSLMGGPTHRGVLPGSTVLTLGTGGVSMFAVQFAKAMGCNVIATTSSRNKEELLKSMGVDAVINYMEEPAWGEKALELTNGAGVDLVVEVGGANTLPQSIIAAKIGGRIAMVGVVGGMGTVDYRNLLPVNHKTLTLYANGMGSRRDLEQMLTFVGNTRLAPVIDKVYSFDDAEDAFRHFSARKHIGKVVISNDRHEL